MTAHSPNRTKNILLVTWEYLAVYASVLLLLGYQYGTSDQTEGLSYALFLGDPTLYPSDFYIQFISSHIPNERYPFALLMKLGMSHIELWAFLCHAACSMVMIYGLRKISGLYIRSSFFRWLSILTAMVLMYQLNLGGNELYYNYMVPSLPAKAMSVWVLYWSLTGRWVKAFVLLNAVILFQPVVGAQVFLLQGVLALAPILQQGQLPTMAGLRKYLPATLCALPGLAWLLLLWQYHHADDADVDFLAIVRMRMPHHYFPDTFSWLHFVASAIFFACAYLWYRITDRRVGALYVVVTTGALVYSILLYQGWDLPIKTQWFKTTIWLETFSVMALFGWLDKRVMLHIRPTLFLTVLAAMLGGMLVAGFPPVAEKPRDRTEPVEQDPSIEIAQIAHRVTPQQALFIIPPDNSNFRFIAQRSVFVDFKSIAHQKSYLKEWYRRVHLVYGLSVHMPTGGFALMPEARAAYRNLSERQVQSLISMGVTHMLTWKDHQLDLPVVAENEQYRIYQVLSVH